MNIQNRRLLLIVILLSCINACSINSPFQEYLSPNRSEVESKLGILQELQSILGRHHSPLLTTIQINMQTADEHPEVLNELLEGGYGVQRVTGDQGDHFLTIRQNEDGRLSATLIQSQLASSTYADE